MSQTISRPALSRLVDAWISAGHMVGGPVRVKSLSQDRWGLAHFAESSEQNVPVPLSRRGFGLGSKDDLVQYRPLTAAGDLLLEGFIRPANSIKEFLFPRHEKLYGYRIAGKQIELTEAPLLEREQILVGARPCDAASLPILDHVFHWDCEDVFYSRRRQRTTIVTLACRNHDEHCFCTSVGLAPDAPQGSDAMLFDLGNGEYDVRLLTEKGRRLFEGQTQSSDSEGKADPGPERTVDVEAIRHFLDNGFDNPAWRQSALRCLGCGACAYGCPTCHCFDIADEGNAAGGWRVRNWDTCQAAMFTMHASGHNPRPMQVQRQRQRIFHKYRVYPEKFGVVACTGCGNCTRSCPVGLGVRTVLEALQPEQTS
ncbi:MAG: heterodisulfide reductase subunit A [Rhodopirellula sp.]|nr:heterodisulfide reductase subunit A [Rhodopirellula sp.]